MKKFVIPTLVFLCMLLTVSSTTGTYKINVKIHPDSQLTIVGNTNINKFNCGFDSKTLEEPIPVEFRRKGDNIYFKKAKLKLNTYLFDCGKKLINKDFQDLIKAETYPDIYLILKEVIPSTTDKNLVNAKVDFKIAGKTKEYTVPVTYDGKDDLSISGKLQLNIRDFDLENPKKLMGLIKVDDVITINFNLHIDTI